MMHDPVQGKNLSNVLNDLLCERAMGRVRGKEGEESYLWVWDGRSALQPADRQGDEEGLISYGDFLRKKYPMTSNPELAKQHKRMRKQLRREFTAVGGLGAALRHEFDEMLEYLRFPQLEPPVTSQTLKVAGLENETHFFMVPAFFRFVQELHVQGTTFNLIFRTFGFDLERIACEFNAFCEGKHPFFPLSDDQKMDGSCGGIDRRLHLGRMSEDENETPRFGTLFRSDGDIALVLGTFDMPEIPQERSLKFYEGMPNIKIAQGLDAIHHLLAERWRASQATLAIRDYYPFWASKMEAASAGKLLTIDPRDATVHSVFFDDNILVDDAHIIDVRKCPGGECMPFAETRELYLLRVEPTEVIFNRDYFLQRLNESLQLREARGLGLKN